MRSVSVSAIVPVYNHGATVSQAIDSALAQEFEGVLELIAVNDGSTDRTQEVLDSYGSRIKVIRQSNRGHAAARNAAAAQSRGQYLAFLDADDIWLPGRVSKTVAALERNPHAVLAFSDAMTLSETGELAQMWAAGAAPSMQQLLKTGWTIFPSSTTVHRLAFDACGGFEERLRGFVDSYFLMVLREQGEFEYIAEPLIIYRATPHERMADRYLAARGPFLQLVRRRYGPEVARQLAADTAQMFSTSLLHKASMQRRNGAYCAAIETLIRAIQLTPAISQKVRLVQRLLQYVTARILTRMSSRLKSKG